MKKILLLLFVFASFFANAQNFKTHPKKPYSPTDSCLVWQDSTKKFYRIRCLEMDGGSATIDTTKVGRIEQGRGTAPIFMYFNGTSWVRNDTSYIPRSGASNITGNLKSNQSYFQVGLNSNNNSILFSDGSYTSLVSNNSSSNISSSVQALSSSNGDIVLGISNPTSGYSRKLTIKGAATSTPNLTFEFDKGIGYYNGDYSSEMETSQNLIPSLKKVKQLISDSVGTAQSTTLADGKIWIGDGTDTAFPRTLSGDVTVSNLGGTTIANGAVTNAKLANSTISGVSLGSNLNDLTISTGLSLNSGSTYNGSTARTITNNVLTGVSGGQTWVGSTSTNSGVTYKTTTGVGATGADHIFVGGNNGATEFMRILNSGNVGIGTSTPSTRLMVSSGSAQYPTAISILPSTHVSSRRAGLSLDDWLIMQDKDGSGTKDFSLYQISAMQPRITISTAGNMGIGAIVPTSKLGVLGNTSIGATYATIAAPTSGAIIEGNVGIGISSPTERLHVVGNAIVSANLTVSGTTILNAGIQNYISFKSSNYSITTSNSRIIAIAGITGTLPNGSGLENYIFSVTNAHPSSTTTLTTTSSQVFGNVSGTPTSLTIAAGATKTVVWAGSSWIVIGN